MNREIDLIWHRIRGGDEKAFESAFKELYPSLLIFAQRILNKMPEAEETVNDAFIKLWQNKADIILKGSFKSYMYQTVHNLALNKIEHYNSLKNQPNKTNSFDNWKLIYNSYVLEDSIIQNFEAAETEHIIKDLIEKLPEKCKEVFKLSRFHNLSHDEIATKLQLSPNTVRVQIFRALEFISKNISEK